MDMPTLVATGFGILLVCSIIGCYWGMEDMKRYEEHVFDALPEHGRWMWFSEIVRSVHIRVPKASVFKISQALDRLHRKGILEQSPYREDDETIRADEPYGRWRYKEQEEPLLLKTPLKEAS